MSVLKQQLLRAEIKQVATSTWFGSSFPLDTINSAGKQLLRARKRAESVLFLVSRHRLKIKIKQSGGNRPINTAAVLFLTPYSGRIESSKLLDDIPYR